MPGHAEQLYEDILLQKIITAYQVTPYQPPAVKFGPKEKLGRALFFDPILSGPQGVACATCHIRSKGSADGLPLAIGLGASGLGKERMSKPNAFIIPRNTLPLYNRGSEDINAFFWDGRVQIGVNGKYESPLGDLLPKGFDSLLSVACVFPIVEPDEMLGHSSKKVGAELQYGDLVRIDGVENDYQARALNVFANLPGRLFSTADGAKTGAANKYQSLMRDAYPDMALDDVSISEIGNVLASYIRAAFALDDSSWDRYVQGDKKALTLEQKQGAIVFYGKGRCVVCHSGEQFSDFKFHGLAIPQLRIGKHSPYMDYGRAAATGRPKDRYMFRTPTLRNVSETGPWGHNGIFETLHSIIEHHINPVLTLYEAQRVDPQQGQFSGRLLSARSEFLAEIGVLSNADVDNIIAFLSALSSKYLVEDQLAIPDALSSQGAVTTSKL